MPPASAPPPGPPPTNTLGWRPKLAVFLALAAFALIVLLVLWRFDPAKSGFYPGCAFHQLTGLNCPGCGGLRATHRLLHGRILEAAHHNLLVVLAVPVLAGFAGRWAWRRYRRVPPRLNGRYAVWFGALLVAMLLFAVLRNLPIAPFNQLSP